MPALSEPNEDSLVDTSTPPEGGYSCDGTQPSGGCLNGYPFDYASHAACGYWCATRGTRFGTTLAPDPWPFHGCCPSTCTLRAPRECAATCTCVTGCSSMASMGAAPPPSASSRTKSVASTAARLRAQPPATTTRSASLRASATAMDAEHESIGARARARGARARGATPLRSRCDTPDEETKRRTAT